MKIIVGLGNPGEKYENTRHNIGFLTLDRLKTEISKSKFQISNNIYNFKNEKKLEAEVCKIDDVVLVKPQTFMNDSGRSIQKVLKFFLKLKTQNSKLNDLWIIHDDLDIKQGEYKIQFGKGPKVHNGVNSVESILKTKNFWRVRVGVDGRDKEILNIKYQTSNISRNQNISGREYVLKSLALQEKQKFNEVIVTICEDLLTRMKV